MLFCNRFNSVSVFLLLLFKQFCLARFRFVSDSGCSASRQRHNTQKLCLLRWKSQSDHKMNANIISLLLDILLSKHPKYVLCTKNSNKNREDKNVKHKREKRKQLRTFSFNFLPLFLLQHFPKRNLLASDLGAARPASGISS